MMIFNLVSFYFNVILVPRIPNPETRTPNLALNTTFHLTSLIKKLWTNFSKNYPL